MSTNAQFEAELCARLRAREESLLDPSVRRDRERIASLLTEDFQEFGASGATWSREQILDLLATENYDPPAIEDFQCHELAEGIVLVTYKTVRTDKDSRQRSAALRSSIWIESAGDWRLRFHQATRAL